MILRVTLEIVPHGEECHKHVIRTIDISNLGPTWDVNKVPADGTSRAPAPTSHCSYVVKTGGAVVGFIHCYRREDGPTELARRALALATELDRRDPSVL